MSVNHTQALLTWFYICMVTSWIAWELFKLKHIKSGALLAGLMVESMVSKPLWEVFSLGLVIFSEEEVFYVLVGNGRMKSNSSGSWDYGFLYSVYGLLLIFKFYFCFSCLPFVVMVFDHKFTLCPFQS